MKKLTTLAVAAVVALTAVTSRAVVSIVGSTSAQNLLQTSAPPPGTLGQITGTVQSWVLDGFSGPGYTFVYQVVNNGPDAISQASFSGFGGGSFVSAGTTSLSAAAFFGVAFGATPTGGAGGSFNLLTPAGAASFNEIDSNVAGSNTSQFLYVITTARAFATSSGRTIDGITSQGATLAPVPEPSTVVAGALLLLPLGASALRVIRKNRTA